MYKGIILVEPNGNERFFLLRSMTLLVMKVDCQQNNLSLQEIVTITEKHIWKLGRTNPSEYIMTPASIAHGRFQKREKKDCNTQNTRKYAVNQSFLVIAT